MRRRTALLLGIAAAGAASLLIARLLGPSRPRFEARGPGAWSGPGRRAPVRAPARSPRPPAERSPDPAGLPDLELALAPPPGFHARPVRVSPASTPPPGLEVRYTTGGADPESSSPRLEGPLALARDTVIRAAGFAGGARLTRVVSASYFIGPPRPLPVFSISLDPADFQSVHLDFEARGREAERPAYLEVFDREGKRIAATGFGMRLHGGAGRQGGLALKKAYRAYFRKRYGEGKLRAPLFPDSPVEAFDALVLRSGYNDRLRPGRGDYNVRAAYIRDEVIRDLHRDMGAPAVRGAWCLLYLNGEPRGLYNVVERPGDEFLAAHLGGAEWDVIKTGDEVQSGSAEEWDALLDAVARSAAGARESYEEIERRVDLKNFAVYIVLNHWAQNYDWSFNNWYAARRRAPGERWIFLSWDAEWGLGLRPSGFGADALPYHLSQRNSIRDLLAGLLDHREFRALLLQETREQLAGALRPERVLAHLARHREAVAPVMEEELRRFSGGSALEDWRENVEAAESFARGRGEVFRRLTESHLAEPFRMPAAGGRRLHEPAFFPGGAIRVPVEPRGAPRRLFRFDKGE